MSMSMTKKLVLTAAAVALVLFVSSLLNTHVFAAASLDEDPELSRLEMAFETMTVRVNQERQVWVSMAIRQVIPTKWMDIDEDTRVPTDTRRVQTWATNGTDDFPITWTSSNTDVAWVDGDGRVTGISPGTAVITASAEKDRHTTLTATCTVTVPSSVLTGIELHTSNEATAAANSGERLEATRVRADVEAAVRAAEAGQTATVTYSERTVVSTAALRSAAFSAEYEGGQVRLRLRTLDEDGAIQGQLTIQPERAVAEDYDILLGVTTASQSARNAAAMGKSYFGASRSAGVVLAQRGEYGMGVEVAARADLPAGTAIRLYRYEGGSYTLVEDAGCRMDDSGYLHFSVNRGGTYVAVA